MVDKIDGIVVVLIFFEGMRPITTDQLRGIAKVNVTQVVDIHQFVFAKIRVRSKRDPSSRRVKMPLIIPIAVRGETSDARIFIIAVVGARRVGKFFWKIVGKSTPHVVNGTRKDIGMENHQAGYCPATARISAPNDPVGVDVVQFGHAVGTQKLDASPRIRVHRVPNVFSRKPD